MDAPYLFASLSWSAVGVGYYIYGKRQQSFTPMIAGILMIGVSYFVASPLFMSLACAALLAGNHWILRHYG